MLLGYLALIDILFDGILVPRKKTILHDTSYHLLRLLLHQELLVLEIILR